MQNNGYLKCNVDHCCYFRKIGSNYIILLLYVDDMLVVDTYLDEINKLKKQQLSSEFEMKDLSVAKRILGMTNSKDKQWAPYGYIRLSIFVRYCRDST